MMMNRPLRFACVCVALFFAGVGDCTLVGFGPNAASASSSCWVAVEPAPDQPKPKGEETYTVEVTDYRPRPSPLDELLSDDVLGDKTPKFDPKLVHSRVVDGWRVNLSASVIRLDVPIVKPDQEGYLLTLHPSYTAALKAASGHINSFQSPLPSVNLIDGLAKQFDDGLYAALDQAYYQGLGQTLESHVALVRRIFDKVDSKSAAKDYLGAGLELAGQNVTGANEASRKRVLKAFLGNQVLSKPIGVYTWTPSLEKCFRFLRFFQQTFTDPAIPRAIAQALAEDPVLRKDYEKAVGFYAKLTNPLKHGSILELLGEGGSSDEKAQSVAMFPASRSRESELFEHLFPKGLPANANLMKELITRIRSGEVDLSPHAESGWYDYQVHALETLLLPEEGRENQKLLLTKSYKKRMLEAFQALMTKRRETHVRQLGMPAPTAMAVPPERLRLRPELRLEPAVTYYLRTARAYAFLVKFLDASFGESDLKSLHGLRQKGQRSKDLSTDLRDMRDLFYGFYMTSCEDIGLAPSFRGNEEVNRSRGLELASAWLSQGWKSDADLATDTRISVPIMYDARRNVTRLWVTLGVRLARLDSNFARAPRIRPDDGEADWTDAKNFQLEGKQYIIPVDEFAEVELKGARVLTRDELRSICDKHKTKEAIVQALQ
jgi:hypothetical protein